MASALTWLDSSREDQQRMRELLNLFTDSESRDELGIGQVRDAFSDLLFPGISTLHTRARYLLIAPWCFQEVERRGSRGDSFTRQVDRNERKVIETLLKFVDQDGVIGRVAGVKVRTLPSVIYQSALLRFGIRTDGAQVTGTEWVELADRIQGPWHPTLPGAPTGFPGTIDGGLRLEPQEARWLRERILTAAPDTLLTHLLDPDRRDALASAHPWDDPAVADASAGIVSIVQHAARFSLAIHGAALLYNLLIADRYEEAGLEEHVEPAVRYRELLALWSDEVTQTSIFAAWDRADMWSALAMQNPRINANAPSQWFINHWLDAVVSGGTTDVADDETLRKLVGERERMVKKAQSRLVNDKLLRAWSGASGSRRLLYRWPQASRMLDDIQDGCVAHAGA